MSKTKRISEIDDLRGLAMLVMILIHTNAYFLSDNVAYVLWNYSQFAVPVFLFCSAYIFYSRKHIFSIKEYFTYLRKRFLRLLIPYYIFAFLYIVMVHFKEPKTITGAYITQSALLVGGVDINWLVLLFLCLTSLMPLISHLEKKHHVIYFLYVGMAILFSVLVLFFRWPWNYRFIMWLPWSLVYLYTMYFIRYQNKRIFLFTSVLFSSIVFGLLWIIETMQHHSLSFIDNKYPPNMFMLSYGILSIIVLYISAMKGMFFGKVVKGFFHFLSTNSYTLYFIHYMYLYLLSFVMWKYHWPWVVFFLAVLTISVITQQILHSLLPIWKRNR